jgi:AraC-like DNA-binding protein
MTILYNHTDYKSYLEFLAATTGAEFDGTTLYYPPHFAEGKSVLFEMAGGLQALTNDFTLQTDATFKRPATFPEMFILRADYVNIAGQMKLSTGEDDFTDETPLYANIMLTSTRYPFIVDAKKGTRLRNYTVILSKQWLLRYFPADIVQYWINYIHTLRLKSVNMVPLNFEMREALFSLIDLDETHPARMFHTHARTFEIADYYFKQLIRQEKTWGKSRQMMKDVDKLIELDIYFTGNFEKSLPNVEEMAEFVHMSATKLKSLFKKMYNQSIYDYFNSCRLNKARELLLQKNLTLKEISASTGYKTVQHFSASFKKEFSITPGELLQHM